MHPNTRTFLQNPLYTKTIYMHLSLSSLSTNLHHNPEVHIPTFLTKMQASKDLISSNSRNPNEKNSCCTISLLEGDGIFFNRLLSREPSKGFSSRIYYRVATGNVPFEWEAQPGKPKVAPESMLIPPLSPPPAMVGSGLALPRSDSTVAKGSTRLKLWSRKKKARKSHLSKSHSQSQSQVGSEDGVVGRVESFGFWSNEGDSTWSPRDLSSSSSSSSSSSVHGFYSARKFPAPEGQMMMKDSDKRRGMDWAWRCGPWSFAGVMVCMAKGV